MILYIAKRGPHNIIARMHLQALRDIYGKKQVYVIDLLSSEHCENERFLSFGYRGHNMGGRICSYLEGNISFINNHIISRLCDIIKNFNVTMLFTEESDLGNLCKKIKSYFPHVKIICFFHDVSAELFKMRIKDAPKWKLHYILECIRVINQEKVCQNYADQKWVFNEADSNRFYKSYGYYPDRIIPISSTKPTRYNEYKNAITEAECKKNVLFVCSAYYVNIAGFKWFYHHVLPNLDKKYHIQVVGNGSKQLTYMTSENIEILGEVESMVPYYINSDFVIIPVFDGGGMKVKTVEALSFAKCIISTSESLNGYWEATPQDIKNNLIYQCNTIDQWVVACNNLLNLRVKRYNEQVLDMFNKNFSYEVMLEKFEVALSDK